MKKGVFRKTVHMVFLVTAFFVGMGISELKGFGLSRIWRVLAHSAMVYFSIRYVYTISKALGNLYPNTVDWDVGTHLAIICVCLSAVGSALLLI